MTNVESIYERNCDIVLTICQFCPVCAEKLIKRPKTVEVFDSSIDADVICCPDGHVQLDTYSHALNEINRPDAVFELAKSFFK